MLDNTDPLSRDSFSRYGQERKSSVTIQVLNDQWQVVAVHHKAVPAPHSTSKKNNEEMEYIGNEGVRISAVFQHLNKNRFEDDNANAVLNRLSEALGLYSPPPPLLTPNPELGSNEQYSPFKVSRWKASGLGYDPAFLSEKINLDDILKDARKKHLTAPLLKGGGDELKYLRFSVVIHKTRKFALMTAVNIDGAKLKKIARKDTWRPDARIASEYQPDDQFYVKKLQKEKVYFSRGHLVRLLDPSWARRLKPNVDRRTPFTLRIPHPKSRDTTTTTGAIWRTTFWTRLRARSAN